MKSIAARSLQDGRRRGFGLAERHQWVPEKHPTGGGHRKMGSDTAAHRPADEKRSAASRRGEVVVDGAVTSEELVVAIGSALPSSR